MKYILFAALVTVAYGATWKSRNADMYLDAVLKSYLPSEVRSLSLNPAHLSNFSTVINVPVFGRLTTKFGNGNVTGLSDAYRLANCSGPGYVYNNISINCTVGFRSLKISYTGNVRLGVAKKFYVNAQLTSSYIVAYIMSSPHFNTPYVKFMVSHGLGVTKSSVTGLGPGNAAAQKAIEDSFNGNVTINVQNLVNNQFQSALNRAVSRIPMPLP